MRKTLVGLVALLLIVGMASACSDIEDGESASSSSGYTVPEYKDMPDLRHMSLEKAVAMLQEEGWKDVEAVEENNGAESAVGLDQTGYHIANQDPYYWKTGVSTDTHVRLTVHKDQTRVISNLVTVDEPWDEAFDRLRSAGLNKDCDYILVGGVGDYIKYYVKRLSDGDADNRPPVVVETYRDEQRHEEQEQEQNTSGQEAHGGAFCATEGDTHATAVRRM